jgi:hypothetical protein
MNAIFYALAVAAVTIPVYAEGTPTQRPAACPHPVTLEGHFDARAPNLTVLLNDGFEPSATAHMLAEKYHFTVLAVFTHAVKAFAIKDIDVAIIPLLQCEPSISVLSFDAPTTIT